MKCETFVFFAFFSFIGVACVGVGSQVNEADGAQVAGLKMRHQIMFDYGGEIQVFEGYMISAEDSFLVKAFAGPGVDLFTVIDNNGTQHNELHLQALKDRIDLAQVGADIARAFLSGCVANKSSSRLECDFHNEPLVEKFDEQGRLVERFFPQAHQVGLKVYYSEYATQCGDSRPVQTTLRWGQGNNRIVIRMVGCELLNRIDPKIFLAQ
jgi:hypothetical protein